METKTYLLRDINKNLWGKVKTAAFDSNMSIKDWLIGAIQNELNREKDGKKANKKV